MLGRDRRLRLMSMEPLSPEEARVLGCLVEKERTTPEYYPLTVNALVAACNQKTNRHPVVEYDDLTVERALRSLDSKGLIGLARSSGGRTTKYLHRAEDTYQIDNEQLAILAVLLLRGSQTPGELRGRAERYFDVAKAPEAIEIVPDDLMARAIPLVQRLPRAPGQKENRYRTLLVEGLEGSTQPAASPPNNSLVDRVTLLERQLRALAGSLGINLDDPNTDGPDRASE